MKYLSAEFTSLKACSVWLFSWPAPLRGLTEYKSVEWTLQTVVWKFLFVVSLDSVVYWYITTIFYHCHQVVCWTFKKYHVWMRGTASKDIQNLCKKMEHNFIHHTIKYFELSLQTVACLPSISVFNQNNTANCSKTGARTPAVLWTVLPVCQGMFIWLQLLPCELSGSHLDISWSILARYNNMNRICGNKCKHAK